MSWTGGDPSDATYAHGSLNGSTTGFKEWDVAHLVQSWVEGQANNGLVLQQTSENVESIVFFASTSSANAQERWPRLEVTYSNLNYEYATLAAAIDEATLACMRATGEVGSGATVASTFGIVGPDGLRSVPTAPIDPSGECVQGGLKVVATAMGDTTDVQLMDQNLRSLTAEIQAGRRVDAVALPAEEPVGTGGDETTSHGPCGPPLNNADAWMWWMNAAHNDVPLRLPNSQWDFAWFKNNQYPCNFDWNTDGCTDDIVGVNLKVDYYYGFTPVCVRHDFGYRNLKLGEVRFDRNMYRQNNKAVADTRFYIGLLHICPGPQRADTTCNWWARVYYWGVSAKHSYNTFNEFRYWFYK